MHGRRQVGDLPPVVPLAQLNFYAVTAYDILRVRGVPIGKRHYEGLLRTRCSKVQKSCRPCESSP